jgi:integrase
MLRTKSGLPKHCSWNTDRHGRRRARFRKLGFTTYLSGTPWSEDFMRQYATALDGVKEQQTEIGSSRTRPGSLDALVVSYYKSPEFRGLKPSVQTQRRYIIERFRKDHGDKPIKSLKRAHIAAIIGAKASTPHAANALRKTLRVLLAYAVDQELLESNPVTSVKKYKTRGEGFHSWSEDEIARFQERHPVGTRAHLALALLLYTGQRRIDVIRMGWQHVNGDEIAVRQEKTDTPLWIPMHPKLALALRSVPRTNLTFLVTQYGAPFSPESFSNWFRAQCNMASLPQCSAHGLRKAAATRMANAGCTSDQIKAITGHKSLSEVAHYTKAADQRRLARQALEILLRAEGEQDLSNLPTRLDKKAAN